MVRYLILAVHFEEREESRHFEILAGGMNVERPGWLWELFVFVGVV